jgi:hypothetical protein
MCCKEPDKWAFIGAKPDSGFDDPLGMLKDCHRRIEHFLGILCIVAERAQGRVLTEEEIAAVEAALNYFRLGGQRHTADEEDSLFPCLISVGGFAELDRLEHDHEEAGQLHDDQNGFTERCYRIPISCRSFATGRRATSLHRSGDRRRRTLPCDTHRSTGSAARAAEQSGHRN